MYLQKNSNVNYTLEIVKEGYSKVYVNTTASKIEAMPIDEYDAIEIAPLTRESESLICLRDKKQKYRPQEYGINNRAIDMVISQEELLPKTKSAIEKAKNNGIGITFLDKSSKSVLYYYEEGVLSGVYYIPKTEDEQLWEELGFIDYN